MIRLGALSFKVESAVDPVNWSMNFERNKASILDIYRRRGARLNLLVLAGWALRNCGDIDRLVQRLKDIDHELRLPGGGPGIFVEARHGEKSISEERKDNPHRIFYIAPDKSVTDMGEQVFRAGKDASAEKLARLAAGIDERVVPIPGSETKALLLCCGELNVVGCAKGIREGIRRPDTPDNLWKMLTAPGVIYINPTHDVMANPYGYLGFKRTFLSRDNGRAYLSVSNWNAGRNKHQRPERASTCYHDGTTVGSTFPPEISEAQAYSEYELRDL